jgi:hypothetical protein
LNIFGIKRALGHGFVLNYFQNCWDKFGWVFIFCVCGCNGVGDEARLVDDGNKNGSLRS